jgi:hypothetical protein
MLLLTICLAAPVAEGKPLRGSGAHKCATTKRNMPDGRDPFGGCFPGPSNTGVPKRLALSNYRGPCRITQARKVISRKTVNCHQLEIAARGVRIRYSQINGTIDTSGSLTIIRSTVDAGEVNANTNDGPRALNGSHFTAIRVETVRGISGGYCQIDCLVRDSWIHGQDRDEGGHAHQSGFRQEKDLRFVHNTVACDAPEVPPDAGCSADITGYGDFTTIERNTFEHNLLAPSPEGAFCAYGGSTEGKPYPNGNNNVWRDNIFARGRNGKCATYGPVVDGDWGRRGNLWVNNRWDRGGRVRPGD